MSTGNASTTHLEYKEKEKINWSDYEKAKFKIKMNNSTTNRIYVLYSQLTNE